MLTHRAIRRDYDAAGSVNALLALWAFVDDSAFVTKAGDVGLVYRLYGQDYEGLDHAQRRHVVHQCEAALRLLDERSRVYQYFFKRQAPPISAASCASPVIDQAVRARAAPFTSVRREELAVSRQHDGGGVRAAEPIPAQQPLPQQMSPNERRACLNERSITPYTWRWSCGLIFTSHRAKGT